MATEEELYMLHQRDAVEKQSPRKRITDKLFPSSKEFPNKDIGFSTHDMTRPFPSEFLGRFSVVHVGLLLFALKVDQMHEVLTNLAELLAPNGYLIWDDLILDDLGYQGGSLPAKASEYVSSVAQYSKSVGFSGNLPDVVRRVLEEKMGYPDVVVVRYDPASKPEEAEACRQWYRGAVNGLVPVAMRRGGVSEEELSKRMIEVSDDIEASFAQGMVPNPPIGRVVAKKAV